MKHTARSVGPAALVGLLLSLAFFLSGSPLGAQDPDPGALRNLERIEQLLPDEKYDQARKRNMRFANRVAQAAGPGREGEILLGRAALFRALAETGLGNDEEAEWYLHVAEGIDPQLRDFDLDPFGEPGRRLRENLLRRNDEARPRWGSGAPGVTAPRKLLTPDPRWPRAAREARATGVLVIEVVIDETGRTRQPTVVQPLPTAPLTWVALEAVKDWQFEPAREDGEAIPVFYKLTVRYQLQHQIRFH
jgi:TonB family protein